MATARSGRAEQLCPDAHRKQRSPSPDRLSSQSPFDLPASAERTHCRQGTSRSGPRRRCGPGVGRHASKLAAGRGMLDVDCCNGGDRNRVKGEGMKNRDKHSQATDQG